MMGKEWVTPPNRKRSLVEPSTCPWCGLSKKVYVRAGSELVCIDCVKKDAAMDATWNEGGD